MKIGDKVWRKIPIHDGTQYGEIYGEQIIGEEHYFRVKFAKHTARIPDKDLIPYNPKLDKE